MLPECREGQDSSVVINMAATSTDGIVGTRKPTVGAGGGRAH
jgi:hypothetical protein